MFLTLFTKYVQITGFSSKPLLYFIYKYRLKSQVLGLNEMVEIGFPRQGAQDANSVLPMLICWAWQLPNLGFPSPSNNIDFL